VEKKKPKGGSPLGLAVQLDLFLGIYFILVPEATNRSFLM
jgi:hypothetical protein